MTFNNRSLIANLGTLAAGVLITTAAHAQFKNGDVLILQNSGSGKCVDNYYGKTNNGNPIIQYACNSSNNNQKWVAVAQSDGSYSLKNSTAGKCIDVPGSSKDPNKLLQLYTCNNSGAQKFKAISKGSGVYKLQNVNSGMCIDVPWGKAEDGLQLQQYHCHEHVAQDFKVTNTTSSSAPAPAPAPSATPAPATGGTAPEYNPGDGPQAPGTQIVSVRNSSEFVNALRNANPGDEITLEDGNYYVTDKLWLTRAGTRERPIFVRSRNYQKGVVQFCNEEGFILVETANWIFENLKIEGACVNDGQSNNAHAFHIVYKADDVVLRYNLISNFKSHVKLNGNYDSGLGKYRFPQRVQFLKNTWKDTVAIGWEGIPHNVLNIDGGGGHVVRGNAFVDHVGSNSSVSSSNIYFKYGVHDFVVEQNLVLCKKHIQNDYNRRGIYSGDAANDEKCDGGPSCTGYNGLYRNNIIMHCNGSGNSSGILVHNEKDSVYAHNTEFNVKFNHYNNDPLAANIQLYSNILVNGWTNSNRPSVLLDNWETPQSGVEAFFTNGAVADFSLKGSRRTTPRRDNIPHDFCGNPRNSTTDVGAIDYSDSTKAAACVQKIKTWYNSL